MPLSIRFDNRLDRLADALIERVAAPAAGHPLALHPVIVPSVGVGRWLQQRVAARLGVCARLEPELPGRLLWRWLRELMPALPARSPFEPEVVRWRLLAMFDALPEDEAALAPLRERVAGAPARQRLAVATEVAGLFDRYLAWRRDWLERWRRGEPAAGAQADLGPHEAWQAWLWRGLLDSMPGLADEHPYERLERLVLEDPGAVRAALGGRRVSLFGMPGMSPAQFALFGLLGEVADVAFFAPDPCREWWEDLADSRQRARVLAERPDQAWLYDGEPAVLGDWGRAQRDFVAQVAALQERFGVQASEPFRELDDPDGRADDPPGCLRALRQSVFLRSDAPWQRVPGPDHSIVVHAAHSATRQAEVLHDYLLDCFARLPGLHPSEVAVFCADIESAAPAIDAVFSTVGEARRIPVSISGLPPGTEPLLRAARELLELAGPGPSLPAVEAWLLNPAVAEATGLSADDVAELVRVFDAAGARWGLDASDGAVKHGWRDAIDRLLIGAAVSDELPLVAGMAPVQGLRGSRALRIEPVLRLLDTLASLRAFAGRERPVAQWCERFAAAVERIFGRTRRHEAALARLREALGGLAEAAREAAEGPTWPAGGEGARGGETPRIDGRAFALALDEALRASAPAATASGAVSVCPLGSLRGVPFRVVCLFGMDEGVFPRRGARAEADLMPRAPRFGDRFPRTDERGVFLDAVLAAQDRLAILFRGRDVRDDAPLNPSPVVLELMGWLRERLGLDAQAPARRRMPATADASTIVEHPLHPFSPRAFAPALGGSHAREWLGAAVALAAPFAARARQAGPVRETGAQPQIRPAAGATATADAGAVPEAGPLALDELRSALADPIPFWLRRRIGASLPSLAPQADAREPLWPRDADDRDLLGATARRLLAGEDPARVESLLCAAPRTAGGAVGERQARAIVEHALGLVERAGGAQSSRSAEIEVALADGPAIRARLPLPAPDGRLRIVSGFPLNLHGLVEAWLAHALIAAWLGADDTAAAVSGGAPRRPPGLALAETVVAAPDATAVVRIDDPVAALRHAVDAVDAILAGPPAAFPRAWLAAWRESRQGGPLSSCLDADPERAAKLLRTLRNAIVGGPWAAGELDKPWQAVFWRDAEPDLRRVVSDGDRLWAPVVAGIAIEVLR
ncbi:exodeoxyribonuclease V subunit gamma [Burkholderiaceae bacterium FT117]|uniref:exodeoxyribonuclease V subunit gamma n=1 Tax=Zeimonas sediminis TaxID=2944268 RepID=UPI0023431A94|nr:exodeoxyribonuclease V subunit gamma [Zeimonas sediminis]MCM5572147.1 exodeoxyribonuclease V subunit gamma [Zeimonas sediminis]